MKATPKTWKTTWTKITTKKAWTYSPQRALLRKDGKAFAIVTPDGQNALAPDKVDELLYALNGPDMYSVSVAYASSKPKKKARK